MYTVCVYVYVYVYNIHIHIHILICIYNYIYTCGSFQLAMSVGCLAASHFIATGCFCLGFHILDHQIWGNRLISVALLRCHGWGPNGHKNMLWGDTAIFTSSTSSLLPVLPFGLIAWDWPTSWETDPCPVSSLLGCSTDPSHLPRYHVFRDMPMYDWRYLVQTMAHVHPMLPKVEVIIKNQTQESGCLLSVIWIYHGLPHLSLCIWYVEPSLAARKNKNQPTELWAPHLSSNRFNWFQTLASFSNHCKCSIDLNPISIYFNFIPSRRCPNRVQPYFKLFQPSKTENNPAP